MSDTLKADKAADSGLRLTPCSPCPKCGAADKVEILKHGNKSNIVRGIITPEEFGSFVRCMNAYPGVCHCGPWIARTADIDADVTAAIEAWNRQANVPSVP